MYDVADRVEDLDKAECEVKGLGFRVRELHALGILGCD